MEWFSTSQILPIFCNFFQLSDINCHYSSFPAPGGKKSRLGFANSLLQNFYWPWHKPIFSNFLKLSIFIFLQPGQPKHFL